VATTFMGFTADSFLFFEELAHNNQKAWFDSNRARYDQHVVGAFRGLLAALTPSLLKLNPHFEVGGKTNGSFSRINRDIRFSKDKSPYKSNYYLYVYDGRQDPRSFPPFWHGWFEPGDTKPTGTAKSKVTGRNTPACPAARKIGKRFRPGWCARYSCPTRAGSEPPPSPGWWSASLRNSIRFSFSLPCLRPNGKRN